MDKVQITKKCLLLLCAVLLLSALCGCNKAEGIDEEPSPSPESGDEAGPSPEPEDEPIESPEVSDAPPEPSAMTMVECADFLAVLTPAQLGLDAGKMADYHIYPIDGVIMVDNISCIEIRVYELVENTATNKIKGIFLLARDGSHLYRLDINKDTVKEIAMN